MEDKLQTELAALKESNEALEKEIQDEREKHLQTISEMREIRSDLEQVVDAYRINQAELEDIRTKFDEKCAEIKYLQSELELTCKEKSELKQRVYELEKALKNLQQSKALLVPEKENENSCATSVNVPNDLIQRLKGVKEYISTLNRTLEPLIKSQ